MPKRRDAAVICWAARLRLLAIVSEAAHSLLTSGECGGWIPCCAINALSRSAAQGIDSRLVFGGDETAKHFGEIRKRVLSLSGSSI